ncbi:YbgF trimerization domain-containing protein, partial [Caldovatus aquaticus]
MRSTPPLLALVVAAVAAAAAPLARPALAQIESREGIALQNQILQLRAELEQLRRSGSALTAPSLPPPAARGAGPALPQGQVELLNQLLDRVGQLEEEVRRLRGRLEEAEFRGRQLAAEVEKLRGDVDFRLQQLEAGGRGGAARPAGAAPGAQG